MSYAQALWNYLGRLLPIQKIKGAPNSTDDRWSTRTGEGANYIKLDDGNIPLGLERRMFPTHLFGIYDQSSGTIRTDVLQDLIEILRSAVDEKLLTGGSEILVANHKTVSIGNGAVGAASYDLAAAAGHAYKVKYLALANATRAPKVYLGCDFGAAQDLVYQASNNTQGETVPMIGGYEKDAVNIQGPVWLQPGDSLTIGDENYVAGDVISVFALYEDYTL